MNANESIENLLDRLEIDEEQAQQIADDYRTNQDRLNHGGTVNYLVIRGAPVLPRDRKLLAEHFPPRPAI